MKLLLCSAEEAAFQLSVNFAFCAALPVGHEQTPGVISAFVILAQFKRSSVTESHFQCVWRDVTLCCIEVAACTVSHRGEISTVLPLLGLKHVSQKVLGKLLEKIQPFFMKTVITVLH